MKMCWTKKVSHHRKTKETEQFNKRKEKNPKATQVKKKKKLLETEIKQKSNTEMNRITI